jgi:hypothetical protein
MRKTGASTVMKGKLLERPELLLSEWVSEWEREVFIFSISTKEWNLISGTLNKLRKEKFVSPLKKWHRNRGLNLKQNLAPEFVDAT